MKSGQAVLEYVMSFAGMALVLLVFYWLFFGAGWFKREFNEDVFDKGDSVNGSFSRQGFSRSDECLPKRYAERTENLVSSEYP